MPLILPSIWPRTATRRLLSAATTRAEPRDPAQATDNQPVPTGSTPKAGDDQPGLQDGLQQPAGNLQRRQLSPQSAWRSSLPAFGGGNSGWPSLWDQAKRQVAAALESDVAEIGDAAVAAMLGRGLAQNWGELVVVRASHEGFKALGRAPELMTKYGSVGLCATVPQQVLRFKMVPYVAAYLGVEDTDEPLTLLSHVQRSTQAGIAGAGLGVPGGMILNLAVTAQGYREFSGANGGQIVNGWRVVRAGFKGPYFQTLPARIRLSAADGLIFAATHRTAKDAGYSDFAALSLSATATIVLTNPLFIRYMTKVATATGLKAGPSAAPLLAAGLSMAIGALELVIAETAESPLGELRHKVATWLKANSGGAEGAAAHAA